MQSMNYSTRHLAEAFEVSRETIRVWAREFEQYLSAGARPGKGKTRTYNDDDASVFALVAQLKGDGLTFEDIHGNLQSGQRGTMPQISYEENTTLTRSEIIAALRQEVDNLKGGLKLTMEQLREQRVASDLLREQLASKSDENMALHKEIAELNKQIGRLEVRIELLQDDDN